MELPAVSPEGRQLYFTSDRGVADDRPDASCTIRECFDRLDVTRSPLGHRSLVTTPAAW